MTAKQVINAILKAKNIKPTALASRLGIAYPSLFDRINENGKSKDMTVDKLSEMARVMDYKVVVVPRESRVPEGGYVIE